METLALEGRLARRSTSQTASAGLATVKPSYFQPVESLPVKKQSTSYLGTCQPHTLQLNWPQQSLPKEAPVFFAWDQQIGRCTEDVSTSLPLTWGREAKRLETGLFQAPLKIPKQR